MTYTVKEIYYTLHGEGANAGRSAVFCRFAGCNLWSGRDRDRPVALCRFCDTNFLGYDGPGGGCFTTATELAEAVNQHWPSNANGKSQKFVVCTGGEPLLQLDHACVAAFHSLGFKVAVETNGTKLPPNDVDWISVSPKANAELVLRAGNELKLVYPQRDGEPERYADLDFQRFFLQPMYGPNLETNTRLAIDYCMENPQWELSLQMHKLVGLR